MNIATSAGLTITARTRTQKQPAKVSGVDFKTSPQMTKIQWTDFTWNPWRGCDKISAGCKNCYAETLSKRNPKVLGEWGPAGKAVRVAGSLQDSMKPYMWQDKLNQGQGFSECKISGVRGWSKDLRASGLKSWLNTVRPRVFVASLADVFEDYKGGNVVDTNGEKLYDDLIIPRLKMLKAIYDCQGVDFLLLTKRPEGVMDRLQECLNALLELGEHVFHVGFPTEDFAENVRAESFTEWLTLWANGLIGPENVWMGTSIEDDETAERIIDLTQIPAKLHWISCEPMLGPVDLMRFPTLPDWVVCGGESGSKEKSRPFSIKWARDMIAFCERFEIPFFMKQLGRNPINEDGSPYPAKAPKGDDLREWPAQLKLRQFPEA